jgi:ergothioneine biosynthesis protein EgtB
MPDRLASTTGALRATLTAERPCAETAPAELAERYAAVRRTTERLCAPLATEDYVVQAMPDVSPAKWHLAHVTWFFETFLLTPFLRGYRPLDDRYRVLFNSYYNGVGAQHARPERGHLSRPTVAEVYAYRAHVDRAMAELLGHLPGDEPADLTGLIELGINHEQQHQELILTDLKYNLGSNPLRPRYGSRALPASAASPVPLRWVELEGGVREVGHDGPGFAFDNEGPRHRTYLEPCRLATRLVTNAEWREFVAAGGYHEPGLWLSEGWRVARERGWEAPLYWEQVDGAWWLYTLAGLVPLPELAPVAHVSYFEADAYARWRGARLPTEHEWEAVAEGTPVEGNLQESAWYEPAPAAREGLAQVFGDVWEWTRSAYAPYPGFRPLAGALGEYNGKFMVSQMVLRGGSCATPRSHLRATYRNFFPPDARWQFSGVRLAEDAW